MFFNKYNKCVVVSDNKINDTLRVFNELGISEYEFAELGLGKARVWCVSFKSSKKQFNKFISSRVRVEYIASR